MPATAIDAPVSTSANVRGRRLAIMIWAEPFRLPENSSAHENFATPNDRLAANNTTAAANETKYKVLRDMAGKASNRDKQRQTAFQAA